MQVPLNRNVTHHPGGLNVEFTNTSPVLNQLQSHVVRIFPVSPDPSTNAKDGLIQRPAADCLHTLPVQMTAILTKHLPTTHSSMYYVLNLKHYLLFFGGAELFLRHILSLLDNKKKC